MTKPARRQRPMPPGHRRHRTPAQWIRILLRRPGDHRPCWCPACDLFEPTARYHLGMAPNHPEWLTRSLPDADEEYLADLADELWPCDEYTEITIDDYAARSDDDDGGEPQCTT